MSKPKSENSMGPHSSTLAWKIPWTEESGGLQSMESLRVEHDWTISLWLFTFMHWRRKWQPTPVFLPGESREGGAWWAAVCGVAQSWTRLKWLSSSSSRGSACTQVEQDHLLEVIASLRSCTFNLLFIWCIQSEAATRPWLLKLGVCIKSKHEYC